jgi:hypothetical protein
LYQGPERLKRNFNITRGPAVARSNWNFAFATICSSSQSDFEPIRTRSWPFRPNEYRASMRTCDSPVWVGWVSIPELPRFIWAFCRVPPTLSLWGVRASCNLGLAGQTAGFAVARRRALPGMETSEFCGFTNRRDPASRCIRTINHRVQGL